MMKVPTDGMMRVPTDGMMKNRAGGMTRDPTDGMMTVPTDGMMKVPTDGMVKVPADGMMKNRADGMMRDPTDGLMKDPNGLVATTRRTRTPELAVRGERLLRGAAESPPEGPRECEAGRQRSRGGQRLPLHVLVQDDQGEQQQQRSNLAREKQTTRNPRCK